MPNPLPLFTLALLSALTHAQNVIYGYAGCYPDTTSPHILQYEFTPTGGAGAITPDTCIAVCQNHAYAYAGVGYLSGRCFCDRNINSAAVKGSDNQCNVACNGDQTICCGDTSNLDVYTLAVNAAQDSYSSSSSSASVSRASVNSVLSVSRASANSVISISRVSAASVRSASISSASASRASAHSVSSASRSSINSVLSASRDSARSSKSASASAKSVAATATAVPYHYVACAAFDSANPPLPLHPGMGTKNSLENCATKCIRHPFFGVVSGDQCYCGNVAPTQAQLATSDSVCFDNTALVCPYDWTEQCGTPTAMAVYGASWLVGDCPDGGEPAGVPDCFSIIATRSAPTMHAKVAATSPSRNEAVRTAAVGTGSLLSASGATPADTTGTDTSSSSMVTIALSA